MKRYFKHKIKSLLVVNKIVLIHYLQLDEHFFHAEEHHDFWEFVYADKNDVVCTVDGEKVNLSEGQILFHKPNEHHSLSAEGKTSTSVLVVSFDCLSESMGFFTNKRLTLNRKQISYVREIINISKKTFDITYSSETQNMPLLSSPTLGGEQIIKNNIEMLLIDIMRSMTETEYGNDVFLQESVINDKLTEETIKILKEYVSKNLSIDDIARLTNYSKAYIFKQFKKATGKGVIEYFTELKIKEAKKMLLKGEFTIREISEKLSFDTPNYFSKVFKKFTKLTPTTYKKRISN